MTVSLSVLTSGSSTSATPSTASVTIPNGSVCYVWLMLNGDSPSSGLDATVSSASLSWTEIASIELVVGSTRGRTLSLWRAINTSGSNVTEAINLSCSAASGNYLAVGWSVERAVDIDTSTPNGTPLTHTWTGGAYTFGSVGTPAAGDVVYGGHQSSTASNSASYFDGFTGLTDLATTDGRNLKTCYDTDPQDDTPTCGTTGSSGAAIALLLKAAAPSTYRAWKYKPDVQQILHNPR